MLLRVICKISKKNGKLQPSDCKIILNYISVLLEKIKYLKVNNLSYQVQTNRLGIGTETPQYAVK